VKFGEILSLFDSLSFGGFFFYIIGPSLELSKPHACVACIALLGSLAVVPTLGFCFCFFVVVVYSFFKKTIILWLRVGSKG